MTRTFQREVVMVASVVVECAGPDYWNVDVRSLDRQRQHPITLSVVS